MSLDKVQCLHPEGKHAPAIAAETYNIFKKRLPKF